MTDLSNDDGVVVLSAPQAEDWSCELECGRCETRLAVRGDALQATLFKVSGYHFAGTAVSATRCFVPCPSCAKDVLVPSDVTVPYLVVEEAIARHALLVAEAAAERRAQLIERAAAVPTWSA